MDEMDPAKKQYIIFSAIISFLFSFFWNFVLINIMKGSYAYGFPINLTDAEGFTLFLYRVIDTAVIGAFLIVPVYLGLMWIQNRGGGGY